MLLAIGRVLLGFAAACLAAGLVQVLFVTLPAEIAGSEPSALMARVRAVGVLWAIAATQSGVFARPFAVVAAGVGEWQGCRSPAYYAFGGIGIAMAGFLVQLAGETGGQTVVNGYALGAFLVTGLAAGLVYWAAAGRKAGGPSKP